MSRFLILTTIRGRLLFAAVVVGLVVGIYGIRFGSDEPPQRPSTIPATAFWLAGGDFTGKWIDIRSVESNAFTADVYFESGQIWMSDRFVAPPNQVAAPITNEWLKECIAAPDGTHITVIDNGKEIVFHGTKGPLPPPSP